MSTLSRGGFGRGYGVWRVWLIRGRWNLDPIETLVKVVVFHRLQYNTVKVRIRSSTRPLKKSWNLFELDGTLFRPIILSLRYTSVSHSPFPSSSPSLGFRCLSLSLRINRIIGSTRVNSGKRTVGTVPLLYGPLEELTRSRSQGSTDVTIVYHVPRPLSKWTRVSWISWRLYYSVCEIRWF